jgi:3,4-dihydroxy 2-butanone 4-phosphate synthase/GTP cyclohydrolase II
MHTPHDDNAPDPQFLSITKTNFRVRRPVILLDDTDTVKRSALIFPAEQASADLVNFCLQSTHGATIQVALSPLRADALQLEPMGYNRFEAHKPHTHTPRELVSVEARKNVTTGISAADRAETIRVLGMHEPNPREIVKPGHIFPIRVREGGVLVRSALAEGALDMSILSGFRDAACFLEIFNNRGEYADESQLADLTKKEELAQITISELIEYRLRHEQLIQRINEVRLPTSYESDMKAYLYRSHVHKGDHIAIVKGIITPDTSVLTRVHPEDTFIDVFGNPKDGSNTPLHLALKAISEAKVGVLIYLRRPDQTPLARSLLRENQNERPVGTRMKEYGLGAQILRDLGVRKINLLASSEAPEIGLASYGLTVVHQQPLINSVSNL